MKNIILLTLLCILGYSCQEPIDSSAVKTQLEANWSDFIEAWEAENAVKCVSYYAEDGINMPPSLEIKKGRKEVEEFYNFLFSLHSSSEYTHEILELDVAKDFAIERGQFEVLWTRNDSTDYTYKARTLTQWTKDNNQDWKIQKFLFNNPPAEDSK